MAGMALHPLPLDLMPKPCGFQLLPEVYILDGFFVGGFPAPLDPLRQPFRNALGDINRVGDDADFAGSSQAFQSTDGGGQFHSVVGGFPLASIQFLFPFPIPQEYPPTARPRVAAACAIGVCINLFKHLKVTALRVVGSWLVLRPSQAR